jgi:hypothetical protein
MSPEVGEISVSGCGPRPAPRAEGMVGQVSGQVRCRLGCVAREDLRGAEGTGTPNGCYNGAPTFNGLPGVRNRRVPAVQHRRFRHPAGGQPVRGRLGPACLCTPYRWTKQIASRWGGARNDASRTGRRFLPIKVRVATSFTTSVLRDHGHPRRLSPGLESGTCTAPRIGLRSTT